MLNYLWAAMMAAGIFWAAFHGNMAAVTNGALDSTKEAVTLCITMLGIMSFWCGILKIGENAGLIEQLTKKMRPVIRFLFPNMPADHPAAAHISTNMIANMLGLGWAATPAGLKAMEELENLEEERRSGGMPEERQDSEEEDETAKNGIWKNGMRGAGKTGDGKAGANKVVTEKAETMRMSWKSSRVRPVKKGTASNEMCTFLIVNISSLQLIPINMIAYRSQYGSTNPAIIVGPALAATAVSTIVAVVFCKVMENRRKG